MPLAWMCAAKCPAVRTGPLHNKKDLDPSNRGSKAEEPAPQPSPGAGGAGFGGLAESLSVLANLRGVVLRSIHGLDAHTILSVSFRWVF